jgi:hypothetical protein
LDALLRPIVARGLATVPEDAQPLVTSRMRDGAEIVLLIPAGQERPVIVGMLNAEGLPALQLFELPIVDTPTLTH